ncbi:hypothetical protein WA1_40315 [Scytonema hofmannii PCC 7110]|uniref:Uncharacterized protein n=1 Tax=Scytonema hofmannii PCC 7110 TaxID=128403 RepID=A0A139WU72_9CYAN|nr:hypothetical protein [Scytonema hofmannii]KYC35994.1 hypothetical protein WA1_40315 [Scytonema hofmannii PCC 7110]
MINTLNQPTTTVIIERAEVCKTIAEEYTSLTFKQLLEEATSGEALLRLMGRFFQYSSAFAPCQTCLAGYIAVRKDLFNTSNEVGLFADRSVEIGAGMFFGAIDEFGDREAPEPHTHRALALATLKGMAQFFGYDMLALSKLILQHRPTNDAIRKVHRSGGINMVVDEAHLFRAIGFHLGTEVLGEDENRVLEEFFRTKHPEIVRYLQETEVEIDGKVIPAYYWFSRHIVAEAEHFDAGILSANQALHYYTGLEDKQQIKSWILEGVREIAVQMSEFMEEVWKN